MTIKRKKINYFFLVFALNFFIPIFAMEEEKEQKRKRTVLSALGCESILDTHVLLRVATRDKNIEAAKILLADGARPDYAFREYKQIGGPYSGSLAQSFYRYVNEKTTLHFANLEFFSLFLRNGLDPNTRWRGYDGSRESLLESALSSEYSIKNPNFWCTGENLALYPLANMLLYYGAKVEKNPGVNNHWLAGEVRNLMKHAHARRVHRMAKYLQRCFGTIKHPKVEHPLHLPNEIASMIAEIRYGPLSEEDKKLIQGYPVDDYKKKKN